jgi:predicted permease
MNNWLRRVWHLLNRRRFERELHREMQEHRELMPDPRDFGNPHRLLEQSRDAWGWNWLDDAGQDFRFGLRGLRRAPAFTLTSILILSFGIGVNLTLYQMANVVILRPPDIKEPSTLARFYRMTPESSSTGVPYPVAQFVARESAALSAVLAETPTGLTWGNDATFVEGSFVTPNWFDELGYGPLHGRGFIPRIDGAVDAPPVVVVSHEFWTTRLGSNPAAVGTTIHLNKRAATLVGVMSPEFPGVDLDSPDLWAPIEQRDYYYPDSSFLRDWDGGTISMYGRLAAGVSPASAREQLRSTMAAMHAEQPDRVKKDEWLEPLMATENFMRADERLGIIGVLSLIGLLSSLVLMVAAANIGNLVLSRATGRARELGVRIALGAKRSRIVRQLVVETLPLGLSGAVGALILATWVANTIAAVGGLPSHVDLNPDWREILLSLGLSALALAVIGAIPAWQVAQQELTASIKDGGQQVSIRLDRARVRRFMVAAQVAGSCLLLTVAGMMARNVQRIMTADLGFEYEQASVLEAGLDRYGIADAAARAYWSAVKERVLADPETLDAAMALAPPLGGRIHRSGYDDAQRLQVFANHVDPEFFKVMEIAIVAGRVFEPGDDPATTVIISRLLAQEMYGTFDVVGKGFPRSKPTDTIIGVSGDAHSMRIEANNVAELYRPLAAADYNDAVLIARARGDATRLLPVMRDAASVDARVVPGVRLLKEDFSRRLQEMQIPSAIAVATGVLTLLMACLGIFGVVSYGVAMRTREIGIHMALGARRPQLLQLILRQVLSPVTIGMVLGLVAAVPIGLVLSNGPFQLQSADPVVYLTALLVFATAATAAAMALRVLRADPLRALRHD